MKNKEVKIIILVCLLKINYDINYRSVFHLGVVHTYPEICEKKNFFTNTACVHKYPAYFPAVSGNF